MENPVDSSEKIKRLYDLVSQFPGMPLEEALQRSEGEWVILPSSLSNKDLLESQQIIVKTLESMDERRILLVKSEEEFAKTLIFRGFCPPRPTKSKTSY
jgi:hypothetical protein